MQHGGLGAVIKRTDSTCNENRGGEGALTMELFPRIQIIDIKRMIAKSKRRMCALYT